MSKKIGVVLALVGLCALSLFLVNCGSSSSRPSGLLYVLTQGNNGVGNNVTSYSIDLGSGGLSLINSNASTCTPAGNSCGPPLDIVLHPMGTSAFVLNQGVPAASVPPTIYGYNINSDGSFGAPTVAATLTTGDIAGAMNLDASGQFLFVIDPGSSPAPTTPTCPHAPAGPTDVCPSISVFTVKPGSTTLSLASGSPFYVSKVPSGLSALTFTAPGSNTAQEFLFVTSNFDVCTANCRPFPHDDNTLSVYSVSSAGVLTEQANSPYATSTDPISVQAVNTNGTTGSGGVFVYVGSQPAASGALDIFEVCTVIDADCSASDVQSSLLKPVNAAAPPSPGILPLAMLVDPTNTFLYIVCEGSNQIVGYKINATAGTLSGLNPASQPTGTRPVALALHPSVNSSGEFLYTSNNGSSTISGFSVSPVTGSMTSFSSAVYAPSTPSGMASR